MNVRLLLLLLALAAVGCDSPEASRTRGGGAGADPGNRPEKDVEMHGGSNPFWRTPDRIPGPGPSLESARQAQRLSRQ